MPDIEGKVSETEQQETATPVKPFHHGELDQETAAYANSTAIHVDKATNRRLFWMINRRVLVCMLAVCLHPFLRCSDLTTADILLPSARQGHTWLRFNHGNPEGCRSRWQ
jgi:hypothetical protein